MGIQETVPLDESQFGFRVYKIVKNGPLSKSNIKELSDFIIPPTEIYNLKIPFNEWIKKQKDKIISFKVFSVIYQNFRNINISLNGGYLGCTVNYENYNTANSKLLHVIKVCDNTFAKDILNLQENDDYIIALKPKDGKILTLNVSIGEPLSNFKEMINDYRGKECEFFIYNEKIGRRSVLATIPMTKDFKLGCDVAYGKAHEFPYKKYIMRDREFDEEIIELNG